MLTTLEVAFEASEKVYPSHGSLLHGVIMEKISPDYADVLHALSLVPFSQYVYGGRWFISALNGEARERIIEPILTDKAEEILLKNKNISLKIKSRRIVRETSYKEVVDRYFLQEWNNKKKIIFLTPATYKSEGVYQILPSLSGIFTSLYNKWNRFCADISLKDEEVFNHILSHTRLVNYNLRSARFDLEGVNILGFIGDMTLFFKGPKELTALCHILLDFAQYAGVGAKTSLSMGGVSIT